MTQKFIQLLTPKFGLNQIQQEILNKSTRRLNRSERRIYFETLKPNERKVKLFLKENYEQQNQEGRRHWMDTIVKSLLDKGGEPAIIESWVMDVIGRLEVYRTLRQRSENEGRALKPLTNFGGLSMVLFGVIVITALILFIMSIF
ncbi:hypothetical protein [Desulfolucanica intricata]|uniref:hypothetical protein n=1 Tax=Desulfolucanica intricata TaxID=1285191 RepID=UPI000833CC49|nr:hypothetical protein [Desulfolucanica intricata]